MKGISVGLRDDLMSHKSYQADSRGGGGQGNRFLFLTLIYPGGGGGSTSFSRSEIYI